MMNQAVIPELLQENFTTQNLLHESNMLLLEKEKIDEQLKSFDLFLQQFNDKGTMEMQQPSNVIKKYTVS